MRTRSRKANRQKCVYTNSAEKTRRKKREGQGHNEQVRNQPPGNRLEHDLRKGKQQKPKTPRTIIQEWVTFV